MRRQEPSAPARREAGTVRSPFQEVDADVYTAVGRELDVLLAERVARAAELDGFFARDVAEPVARFTLDGGRRMRSQFLWWSMRACGGAAPLTHATLRTAAALELIQTCALVHDDVMDGSPRRRGGASFHARLASQYPAAVSQGVEAVSFASSAAVLAGDLALAWSDDIVAATDFEGADRQRVLEAWQSMRTEMVAGQYLDMHGQVTRTRSVAHTIRTACLKTALYTVARPLSLGAAVADADSLTSHRLFEAGRSAGIAFQLRDDLEGIFGDPTVTGKPSGDDLRNGKATYLFAVARARAKSRRARSALLVLESSLGDTELTEARLLQVREILTDTGARKAVEERIRRLLTVCERQLAEAELLPKAADRLRALFNLLAAPAAPGPAVSPHACVAGGAPSNPAGAQPHLGGPGSRLSSGGNAMRSDR